MAHPHGYANYTARPKGAVTPEEAVAAEMERGYGRPMMGEGPGMDASAMHEGAERPAYEAQEGDEDMEGMEGMDGADNDALAAIVLDLLRRRQGGGA